ncbi:cytosolic carboxypeptidase-like protein 5 isoform X2 [Cimex lectularius]|uniref:tubulin-glutamate carboxypeptidase n=1 Tax=Cimex lectularius TaxID=79782 RepID=A0A8I6SFR5_CIMLE|nr:cytosolic carboxypeptidase-like protein 5 isoform X2 [Cimex lectularius]
MADIECGGYQFLHNFDSGNLANVEYLGYYEPEDEEPYFEFDVWTRPDNGGSEYENGNRTWFYFGIRGGTPFSTIKLNIQMNKQSKMYGQGMAPVYRVLPGRGNWERIKDRPTFSVNLVQNITSGKFILSFKHKLGETEKTTTFFAFTYPFSYSDLQSFLCSLDFMYRMKNETSTHTKVDDIYYHRELLCYTLEKRRVDLITISSHHNISTQREPRFEHLFPDLSTPRCFKFIKKNESESDKYLFKFRRQFMKPTQKQVIFLSARVHPGETPSSFVMNGILSFLMCKEDPVAIALRKYYVFKIIPMINPDGVYRGNYRTDTRGVNLNRVYLNPSPTDHPAIYGARKLILFYHHGREVEEPPNLFAAFSLPSPNDKTDDTDLKVLKTYDADDSPEEECDDSCGDLIHLPNNGTADCNEEKNSPDLSFHQLITPPENSGIFLYIDMHGHASKKGIFMYGNHFKNMQDNIDCMLLPKLISINSQHFHFDSCNFTERNMYLKDKKDGSSREGAGRVATLKLIGLIRSYTLECNYNMGKRVNHLPPPLRETLDKKPMQPHITPPKFTPQIFEEVGRSILWSVLDLNGLHPNSRLINSSYRCLLNVREVLKYKVIADQNLSDGKAEMKKARSSKVKGDNSGITFNGSKPKVNNRGEDRSRKSKVSPNPSNSASLSKFGTKGQPSHVSTAPEIRKKRMKRTNSPNWMSMSRLEKKGDAKRLLPEQRRKKLKPNDINDENANTLKDQRDPHLEEIKNYIEHMGEKEVVEYEQAKMLLCRYLLLAFALDTARSQHNKYPMINQSEQTKTAL